MDARTTAAPPPTPSTQQNNYHPTSAAAADVLSRLLHRLPPTLSLPTRRSPSATSPPVISLADRKIVDLLLTASSQLGFFQLTGHDIASQLASSSESEASSLFELDRDKKESYFTRDWPVGFEGDDDGNGESFWLDSDCLAGSEDVGLVSIRELTRALEKLGLEVVEMLANAMGFENPFKKDPTRFCSLMWVNEDMHGEDIDKSLFPSGFYPYVIGLQYQLRSQKCSLLADSGWVTVLPQPDSVMVTIGDIAQVWSNGKLKKVKGRPMPSLAAGNNSRCVSMWLLVTLSPENTVAPLLPTTIDNGDGDEEAINEAGEERNQLDNSLKSGKRSFSSFSFDEYARSVYGQPLFKDPLDRYRI